MSSYIDTPKYAECAEHDWRRFTEARLKWLYGRDAIVDRYMATKADLEAWRKLGRRRDAA